MQHDNNNTIHGREVKPFAEQGHYTVIHDAIFDVVMPMCPANAFKVLMFVIRKTRGWKKESDQLSQTQIAKGCGFSLDTAKRAINWLIEERMVIELSPYNQSTGQPRTVAINRGYDLETPLPANCTHPLPAKLVQQEPDSQEPREGSLHSPSLEGVKNERKEGVEETQGQLTPHVQSNVSPEQVECVEILEDVKGFPKDRNANIEFLEKMGKEFPGVDALQVCKDYEVWHQDNPRKTKNYRSRLRNFFKNANDKLPDQPAPESEPFKPHEFTPEQLERMRGQVLEELRQQYRRNGKLWATDMWKAQEWGITEYEIYEEE